MLTSSRPRGRRSASCAVQLAFSPGRMSPRYPDFGGLHNNRTNVKLLDKGIGRQSPFVNVSRVKDALTPGIRLQHLRMESTGGVE
jgi:hypothetical protein